MPLNLPRLLLASAISSLLFTGCKPAPKAPSSGFHLTLQKVANDDAMGSALLTIQTSGTGTLSVDQDGGHNSILLPEPKAGGVREASIALIASRIEPKGSDKSYIQILIRPQTGDGSFAGGPSLYTLPPGTLLKDQFTITAKDGDYPIDTPIEIARLRGKPVTVTVGKPTK